ncbi:hypothetical protein J6590_014772 [Homalodisca vitripennis]|nr:hypothetical protein J6590_014772 [Homalodisca vitripennis]
MCQRCGKVYKHAQSLHKHQRYECGKEAQFSCLHCPYKAKQKSNLTDKFFCKTCGKVYRHRTSLAKHVRFACGKEAQFRCSHCSYKAKYKSALKSHVILKHGEPGNLN